jgi:hypothetical protein
MGALTSKPFSFSARSWELQDRLTFDFTDTFFSPLKVSFRGNVIMRVLPEITSSALSEWISDRSRFSYDLLNTANPDSFHLRRFKLFSVHSLQFFSKRFDFIKSFYFDYVSAVQSQHASDFSGFSSLTSSSSKLNFDIRQSYSFDYHSTSIFNFKNFFFFGVNFRYQLPVLAINFRKISATNDNFFFNFGFFSNNLVNEFNLGSSLFQLFSILRGKTKSSRLFFSPLTSVFTNPKLFLIIEKVKPQVYAFFDSPQNLVSAEVFSSLTPTPFYPISFVKPHFYLSSQVFPSNQSLTCFDGLFGNSVAIYNFYFFSKKFENYKIFLLLNFSFNISIFRYSNFYTHYTYSDNSINLLLALKRQINFRNNFNYYT